MTVYRSSRAGKFNAKRVKADGYTFDSEAEYARYCDLRFLLIGKQIADLSVHPRYPLDVNGKRICVYEADFAYREIVRVVDGHLVQSMYLTVEDVKGFPTPEYKIKRELFKALYPDAEFRELNTDKASERKAWTKFATSRGSGVQTQGAK